MKKRIIIIPLLLINLMQTGCKKRDDFLNQKPVASLTTIQSLSDCQLLLDNQIIFNQADPALGEASADEFFLTSDVFNSNALIPLDQNLYIWKKEVYDAGSDVYDWSHGYNLVYYANNVLEALPGFSDPENAKDPLRGAALFYRANAFYNLVQTFAMPYDSSTATTELGIPLRLNADETIKPTRASEADCYSQSINDLKLALTLLPPTAPYLTRPTQPAAYGLLARIYLAMGNYKLAQQYATSCLNQNAQLTDYNDLTSPGYASLVQQGFLKEDLYHAVLYPYDGAAARYVSFVDSTLYGLYADNDLRKSLFFIASGGYYQFMGGYDYQNQNFSGIATDEIYLIRAECNARLGDISAAMNDLNTLLIMRWKTGTFIPYTASGIDDAVQQILTERRKELLFRGTRWTDLRRLNKDPEFAITLTRKINGIIYTLPPNDPRYALPIPDNEIAVDGLQQNPR